MSTISNVQNPTTYIFELYSTNIINVSKNNTDTIVNITALTLALFGPEDTRYPLSRIHDIWGGPFIPSKDQLNA